MAATKTRSAVIDALNRREARLRQKQWEVLQTAPVDWNRLARLGEAIFHIELQKVACRAEFSDGTTKECSRASQ